MKREPWHGQSHVRSASFHPTMHPMCVQIAERNDQRAVRTTVGGDLRAVLVDDLPLPRASPIAATGLSAPANRPRIM